MKMATLSWITLNPQIKLVDTRKKFFDQYLYKIVVYVPGTRIILDKSSSTVDQILERRVQLHKSLGTHYPSNNWGTWNRHTRDTEVINYARVDQLEYFKNVKNGYGNSIKIRVEEPNLTIYSEDSQILLDIAVHDPAVRTIEFHRPNNELAHQALERGEILIKTSIEYDYRVVLKERMESNPDVLKQMHDYLISLGDEVSLTKSCIRNLTTKRYWITGCYFYAKDPNVLTFLNLICPGAVSGIFKLTKL